MGGWVGVVWLSVLRRRDITFIDGVKFLLVFPVTAENGSEVIFEILPAAAELFENGGEFDVIGGGKSKACFLESGEQGVKGDIGMGGGHGVVSGPKYGQGRPCF